MPIDYEPETDAEAEMAGLRRDQAARDRRAGFRLNRPDDHEEPEDDEDD